jgi:hypothetical protein
VTSQCNGPAGFDDPVVGQWRAKRVGAVELAAHKVLKASAKRRQHVPGTEWFDTTAADSEKIIAFIASRPQ